jgi:hypothetical protein
VTPRPWAVKSFPYTVLYSISDPVVKDVIPLIWSLWWAWGPADGEHSAKAPKRKSQPHTHEEPAPASAPAPAPALVPAPAPAPAPARVSTRPRKERKPQDALDERPQWSRGSTNRTSR